MERSLSPEEKLLRLIKGSKAAAGKAKETQAAKPKPKPQPEQKQKSPPKKAARIEKLPENFDWHLFTNKILLVAFCIMFAITLLSLAINHARFSKSKKENLAAVSEVTTQEGLVTRRISDFSKHTDTLITEKKPFSYYSEQIKARQLFKPLIAERPKQVKTEPKIKIGDLSKDLKLLGIMTDEPQQAIIEDSKTNKSFFLQVGDSINDMTVEEIANGRVKLTFEDQSIFLSL